MYLLRISGTYRCHKVRTDNGALGQINSTTVIDNFAVLSLEEEQAVYHCLSAERFASFRQKQLAFFTEVLEVFGAPAGRVDPMLFGNTALAMMMVRKAIPEQMPFLFPEAADAMVRFQIDALVAALEAARGEDAPRKETPHDTDA